MALGAESAPDDGRMVSGARSRSRKTGRHHTTGSAVPLTPLTERAGARFHTYRSLSSHCGRHGVAAHLPDPVRSRPAAFASAYEPRGCEAGAGGMPKDLAPIACLRVRLR